MSIKVTINSQEVKNPLARFLITLLGLVLFLLIFSLLFFLLLPFVWFAILSLLLLLLALMTAAPKLVGRYKLMTVSRKSLQHKK